IRYWDTGAWASPCSKRSRPDRVENFGEPRAAPGELLALDQVHRLQIGHVVVERDGPLDPRRRLDALETHPGKGVAREEQGFGGPGSRPGLDWTLARGQGLRIGQQLLRGSLPDVDRDIVPLVVKVQVLVLNGIAADRFGVRIDLMRDVGIDELAVRIEIDGADMQRLVQITEEMRKQKQGFLLVLDRERRRDRLVRQHRDRSANGGDQVMVIGALEAPVKAVE